LTRIVNGVPNVKSLPSLSLAQVMPSPVGDLDFNCCPDPDCQNFGISADVNVGRFLGRGAPARKAALLSNSSAVGLGAYKLQSSAQKEIRRVSTAFEYAEDPHTWMDGREVRCQAARQSGPCDAGFALLSNDHLLDEINRLRRVNGVLDGPACGACERLYLDAPHEFVLNGANGRKARRDGSQKVRPTGVRVIHAPCRGKKGSRFTVSLDDVRHRKAADNIQILQALVNGAGINDLVRMLSPGGTDRTCGVSRVYDRIFWLEKTLLAFEREQLRRWREAQIAEGREAIHQIAHDDIALNINWETSADRRITQLNCSVSADVRSGYVYRIDVDFDPTVDPVSFFNASYLDGAGRPVRLRQTYTQKSGRTFTHPLMHFQRPSGRLDEPQFFAAAASQLAVFRETKVQRMRAGTPAELAEREAMIAGLDAQIDMIRRIHEGYFDLPDFVRDRRAPFTGIMTRDIYTKAAHFVCLRELLPPGWITLITEQEAVLPRILPHVFHDDIAADNFTWLAMTFDKEVKKPTMLARVADYKKDFAAFIAVQVAAGVIDPTAMTLSAQRRAYIADRMSTVYRMQGSKAPYPSSNYQQGFMPQIWIRSPIQSAGETEKVVGFPLLRSDLRRELKQLAFDQEILDPVLRARVAWRVWAATLQPVSTFFNALRERVSLATRAGGRSARTGPAFINGASFNPRVLIAFLNIFRVHYNWFEARQYVAPWTEGAEIEEVAPTLATARVPGSDKRIVVEKRRARKPVHRTPAMRHGIQKEERDEKGKLIMPSLHRILYRPWLFAGTPIWNKLEDDRVDLRRRVVPVRPRGRGRKPARVRPTVKPDEMKHDTASAVAGSLSVP
jgi:hypothetical protein